MEISTVGESLHWSYANLGMAHAAVEKGDATYGRRHYIIRNRLFSGLRKGKMNIGSLADDEKLKLVLPQACCYCASREHLSVDHLIPSHKGGPNVGKNMVWACRSCNSSKGARDMLDWLASRKQFPSLLLLRRYLKLAIEHCVSEGVMELHKKEASDLPFSLKAVPHKFPQPAELNLWVVPIGGAA